MITAVDSNVLIDIFEPDPTYGPRARDALKLSLVEGEVVEGREAALDGLAGERVRRASLLAGAGAPRVDAEGAQVQAQVERRLGRARPFPVAEEVENSHALSPRLAHRAPSGLHLRLPAEVKVAAEERK